MNKTEERFAKKPKNETLKHINLVKSTFFHEKETKKKLINFIRHSNILSMNVKCLEFEKSYAEYMNQKYSVLFNSGSSANLAIIQTFLNLGYIKKGDKIAFSALTWATNVMPIIQLGLIPIPIDVEIDTLNVSSKTLQNTLDTNSDIKMFFISNILGFCDDIDKIKEICDNRKIYFIEDNCESIGSIYKGKKLGSFGIASTMSFYVGHHLSAIEGGIVSTNNDDIFNMLQMVRSHGWDRCLDKNTKKSLQKKYKIDEFYDKYTFYEVGYNLRPTEITGFLALVALEYIDEIVKKREKNFWAFNNEIKNSCDIVKLRVDNLDVISNFAFPLIFKERKAFEIYKNRFMESEIEIRPIVGGNMVNQPFFKKYFNFKYILPISNLIHANGFYFPNNPELNEEEIQRILNILR